MHHQSFNKAFNDEEDILDFFLYSDILNNYHFLQCLQKLNIEPKKTILKWQKEQELIKAKSKQMFQYMNRSKKPKISSSEMSVIFSGNSSSSEQVEKEEKEEEEKKGEEEEEESQLKQKTVEISAVHHIVPSRQKHKTSYDIQQYYRSEYNPGYKKINALLTLYEEEVLNFLRITNINEIVYNYDNIVDHIQKNKNNIKHVEKKLVMLKTIVSMIKFSDHALITQARKAYTDCYKSIIKEKQQPAIDVAKHEVLDFLKQTHNTYKDNITNSDKTYTLDDIVLQCDRIIELLQKPENKIYNKNEFLQKLKKVVLAKDVAINSNYKQKNETINKYIQLFHKIFNIRNESDDIKLPSISEIRVLEFLETYLSSHDLNDVVQNTADIIGALSSLDITTAAYKKFNDKAFLDMLQTVAMFHTTATVSDQLQAIERYETYHEKVQNETREQNLATFISTTKHSQKRHIKDVKLFLRRIFKSSSLHYLVQRSNKIIRILRQNVHDPLFITKLKTAIHTISEEQISTKEKTAAFDMYNEYIQYLSKTLNDFMQYDDKSKLLCNANDFISYIQELENISQIIKQSLSSDLSTITDTINNILADTRNKKTLFVRNILNDVIKALTNAETAPLKKMEELKETVVQLQTFTTTLKNAIKYFVFHIPNDPTYKHHIQGQFFSCDQTKQSLLQEYTKFEEDNNLTIDMKMYADLEIDKSKRTKEIYHTERNELFNYLNKHNIELSDIIFNPEKTNIDPRYLPYAAFFIRRFDFKNYTLQNMFQLDEFLERNRLEKSDIVYNSLHVLRILQDTVLSENDGKFKTRILLFCMKRIIKTFDFRSYALHVYNTEWKTIIE